MLFLWSIVRNTRHRCFERVYLERMAQKRCFSGCTFLSFWFDSSCCPSVSLLRLDCGVLQVNWRGSESEADFYFPWPTAWNRWRPFLWLCILPLLLVSPQLHCPGSCPSRLLDRDSQCTLCGRAVLIGWMGADVTLAEISWTRRSGYTGTYFFLAIGLLGTFYQVCVVPSGQYGPFCDAKCLRLQRNEVFGMVESFSGWLDPQRGWQKLSHHSCHRQFHNCCRGTGYINNLVVFWYLAWAIRSAKAAFLQAAEGDKVQLKVRTAGQIN